MVTINNLSLQYGLKYLFQLSRYMFTKEIGNIEAGKYMEHFLQGCSKKDILSGFDEVMSKVKKRPVPDWDKLE